MNNIEKQLSDAWLGIDVDESTLFNPMDFVMQDSDNEKLVERISWLMMRPEYFSFACKYLLNIELSPFQALILEEMWNRKFPMLIGSRGLGKSFILSVYSTLRALFMPRRKIIVVGAAFRQSKVLFEYMENIWKNAPILRDLCTQNSGPRRDIDRCVMYINDSTVTALPLGDGTKIRGQRAHDIISDEFASIPRDIFENVVAGFAAVASSPIEKVKEKAKEKKAKELGLVIPTKKIEMGDKSNQIILSGTAYYDFNHFAEYWKRYHSIVESRGDENRLKDIFGGEVPKDFDWTEYSVIRIPVEKLPDGFMDSGQIGRAKATIHSGIFQMEYGACYCPDTLITTNRGVIPIQEVLIDDLVLTHKGRFRPVTKKYVRDYNGLVNHYKTFGYNEVIKSTIDHPFWYGDNIFSSLKDEYTCLSNLNELEGLYSISTESFCTDFLETRDKKRLYPRSSQSKITIDQQRAIRNSDICQSKLSEQYELSQSAISYIQKDNRVPKNSIPAILPLNYELGLIIGYYAAEGSIGADGRQVSFALDEHKDTEYQKQLLQAIQKVFGFCGKSYTKKKNTKEICINSRLIAEIIKHICPGHSHDKLILHDVMFSNEDCLRGIIEGYWNGDGHKGRKQSAGGCVNISLLNQIRIGLSYFNISSSINDKSNGMFSLLLSGENHSRFLSEFYNESYTHSRKQRIENIDGYSKLLIKEKHIKPYNGLVYNLEVDEDHSYSTLNATSHNCFTTDSQGFFKRSLIENCTTSPQKPIKLNSGDICFEACLKGDPKKTYVYGVDPASEVDNFSIVVLEVNPDHRKVVHCWTTTRKQHKEKLKNNLVDEDDFYSYCAKKIRDLMRVFPCAEIALDAQGGGIAVMEALQDKDKIREGEIAIWPTVEQKEKDTDFHSGLHILKLCQFANAEWLATANHGLRKDFEDKVVLFPYFDSVSIGLSIESDKANNRVYDTLEDCVLEIEELKDELSMIIMTQTSTGRERWDTPEVKVGAGKKTRLRKDRYSALIMANMSARNLMNTKNDIEYGAIGGFAMVDRNSRFENSGKLFSGPSWFTDKMQDIY